MYGKTKAIAREKLEQMKLAEKEGTANLSQMSAALDEWLASKKRTLKPVSYDRLDRTVQVHIIPAVGDLQCSDFTETTFINKLLNPSIDKGLSYSSIKKMQDTVCAFCNWASAPSRNYMTKDPMAFFEKINRNAVVGEKTKQEDDIATKSLDKEQRASFVSTCCSKWKSGKPRYPHGEALIFDMYTGLRVGELLALRWQDIDLERKTVRVAAEVAMTTDRNPNSPTYNKLVLVRIDYTKTNKPRIVPLSPKAVEAAYNMKELAEEGQEYFVCTEDGALVRPNTISKTMKKVCEAAGIELRFGTNVHALRHTFASMCFAAGMPVRSVSELLGHSSVQITMDTYIHLIKENGVYRPPELELLK